VLLDAIDVTDVPPFERNVNTVFQDYALFPHMNVADNVAYGLRVRGVAAAERRKRAVEMLDLVQLESFADRRSTQLSGGQKQRVALARALINQPKVLLLDEPLGALDLKLREEMQAELKGLQQRLGITFVFVTHDQGEALSMANRVAVFNAGRIEQLDTPRALYTRPKTAFVAGFVGSANVVEPELAARLTGRAQAFAIRPELIRILADGALPTGHVSAEGVLEDILYHGASSRCHVRTDGGAVLAVAQPETGGATALPAPGTRVRIAWPQASAVPLD
jgi:putative spermidine/putrescine transport system ATP-binding protein